MKRRRLHLRFGERPDGGCGACATFVTLKVVIIVTRRVVRTAISSAAIRCGAPDWWSLIFSTFPRHVRRGLALVDEGTTGPRHNGRIADWDAVE